MSESEAIALRMVVIGLLSGVSFFAGMLLFTDLFGTGIERVLATGVFVLAVDTLASIGFHVIFE